MNALEKTILKAARSAAKKICAMADGAWLSEGPSIFFRMRWHRRFGVRTKKIGS